jgi:integrase
MARRRRGEGSISQRSDGLWEGKISLGIDGNGRRKRKTVYGKSLKEVVEGLRRLQVSASNGTLSEAGKMGHILGQTLTRTMEA